MIYCCTTHFPDDMMLNQHIRCLEAIWARENSFTTFRWVDTYFPPANQEPDTSDRSTVEPSRELTWSTWRIWLIMQDKLALCTGNYKGGVAKEKKLRRKLKKKRFSISWFGKFSFTFRERMWTRRRKQRNCAKKFTREAFCFGLHRRIMRSGNILSPRCKHFLNENISYQTWLEDK